MKKKVCSSCKVFVEAETCQLCKGSQFSTSWKGRINVIDVEKSYIAKKVGHNAVGEYAIKV